MDKVELREKSAIAVVLINLRALEPSQLTFSGWDACGLIFYRTYAQLTENRTTEAQRSQRNESLRDILRKSYI